MGKIILFYDETRDPTIEDVRYITIKGYIQPCVFKTYKHKDEILELPEEFLTFPIRFANRLFEYRKTENSVLINKILNKELCIF